MAPPCANQATCPYQQRPSSTSTDRHRGSLSNKTTGGSQSTLNTICSSRKSQPNAFINRLYNSDPNTNMIGEQTHMMEDSDYLSNYAHIKHSHRHPHYHLRRQSQPDEPRLISRNSSSVKSFTSQSYNNPEYFYEIRPARSYDDSRASLISRKLSNQIMLLNSELHLLEQMRDHSNSYPRIDYVEKEYLTESAPPPVLNHTSSSPSECSDASEFHENKTSTLDRKAQKPINSETDSYSTFNDEITQLVSKHFSNSIKQLVAQRFADFETYALPVRRRRHSCGSSESYDDIIIPELFNSPSRIKWNFLTGLPDHSRSQSQIGSSDYKTDFDDEDEEDGDDCNSQGEHECKIDQILKRRSSYDAKHQQKDKTVSIWRTNSYGGTQEDCNAIIFHHDSELVENCCEHHFGDGAKTTDVKDEDGTVYEFELCTKENCEYQCNSQMAAPELSDSASADPKCTLNNEQTLPMPSTSSTVHKNINLKHNKFKMKKKSKKKSTAKVNREHDFLVWSKINFSHLMKKDSCNINSINLKPNSNSSSSNSLNNADGNRRNLKCYQKASSKLRQRPQGSLDITTLILASSASTQARLRSDGGIYFSNPDLTHIPPDLRTMTNFTNINNNITSCQFINNDLRNSHSSNGNVNSHSVDRSQSRGRFNSATNYLTVEESSINSNNIESSNNSDIMQQQHLRGRLRYNQFNLNGIVRRAQRRARKYFNSLSFASRK
jgi:hypothetical protein